MTDADVIVIGGGPGGSTIASLLARSGVRTLLIERDIHPRDHVGESLTPSTNPIFERIGFLPKIEDAGFVHKPGVCWTSPRSPFGRFLSLKLAEFPPPGAKQDYTYNVERDVFDALLLRHAHEQGAKVLQGVSVARVLFEQDRAVGVTARAAEGWELDLRSKIVVDASGRRCVLASQLGMRRKDPNFNQYAIFSWFRDVEPVLPEYRGMVVLYFLGLERAWGWAIPLRDGIWSMGVVTEKSDFQKSGRSNEEFFYSLVGRSRGFQHAMRNARRVRPWWIEADYSYLAERLAGPGWFLVGDALRFVDPIFSSGVDVAMYSAQFAFEGIERMLKGEDEGRVQREYESRVSEGVDVWYELISLFYKLQNLFTRFALNVRFREDVIRVLQGNPYIEDSQRRARRILQAMRSSYEKVMADPANLLRPGALGGLFEVPDQAPEPVAGVAEPRTAAG